MLTAPQAVRPDVWRHYLRQGPPVNKGRDVDSQQLHVDVLSITNGLPINSTDVALQSCHFHIFRRRFLRLLLQQSLSFLCCLFRSGRENLREVPTVTAVRTLLKVYHRIIKGACPKGWKRGVFTRSLAVGQRYGG